jgi:4-hydroxy-tetrahydrodipicolinate reductase
MKIAVMGAAGRMGRQLVRAVVATPGCSISGGAESPSSPALGKDVGVLAGIDLLGISISADAEAVISSADAILDFTVPKASAEFARIASRTGTVHVIGTTGFDTASEAAIRDAGGAGPASAPSISCPF